MITDGPAFALAYVLQSWKKDCSPSLRKLYNATILDQEPWTRDLTETEIETLWEMSRRVEMIATVLQGIAERQRDKLAAGSCGVTPQTKEPT